MINFNKFCVLDFETGSKDPNRTQPLSIGAVMIDPRKLTLCEQGHFYSLIAPLSEEVVAEHELDSIQQDALSTNKLSLDDLANAPPLKKVWGDFTNWVKYHTPSNDEWSAPILCGQGIKRFDKIIVDRIMHGHKYDNSSIPNKNELEELDKEDLIRIIKGIKSRKNIYKFGPKWLFHPNIMLDTVDLFFCLFENMREPTSLSQDALKEFLGFPILGGHNALVDAKQTGEFLIRILKLLRDVSKDTNFKTNGEISLFIDEAPF